MCLLDRDCLPTHAWTEYAQTKTSFTASVRHQGKGGRILSIGRKEGRGLKWSFLSIDLKVRGLSDSVSHGSHKTSWEMVIIP